MISLENDEVATESVLNQNISTNEDEETVLRPHTYEII